jgi:DNA-binding GntR family transcriptional regulator
MAAIRRRDPAAVKECVHAHLLSRGRAISESYEPTPTTEAQR